MLNFITFTHSFYTTLVFVKKILRVNIKCYTTCFWLY